MRLVLTGRHLDISPGLRTLVDRKLVRLERLLGNSIVSAQVVCVRERDRLEADVTVHMRGDHTLASRATGATWSSAITTVVDKIERQGVKVKGKWKERKRRATSSRRDEAPGETGAGAPVDGQAALAASAGPRVVRVTRTNLKPMTVENAALELSATGEAFLVFRNAETDALNVLLRRRAGEFGLLESNR
jgi:ribosome hibernation promoting factor